MVNFPSPEPPTRWSLELLKSMDWRVFEDLCAEIAKRKGFIAGTTGRGADGGIDIVMRKSSGRKGEFDIAVQCKRWKKMVDVETARAFCFAFQDGGFAKGCLISVGGFTTPVKEQFGARENVALIDGYRVLKRIWEMGPQESQSLLRFATREEQWNVPSCASCDVKLVWREPAKDDRWAPFWSCPNYGSEGCTFTMRCSVEGSGFS